ncbi:complex I NDUFA9 subunit family protein [Limoniibacter endophyticus]|uniref:3-beta-hydroxy-Delta(5)-steroid dehydrogenase n=1 Tax=Limoniibacter endophyticus TaxID=1565040 RepID=A0A8J3GGL9_9HYPH|nr:complex I NDUFA9 subunit family protein [Limoniibacter endophyticus]GHC66412.1 3-beta-hydroxy-Delta(5)-steroid dehydrogenase [Limoniibacter endophyticus]
MTTIKDLPKLVTVFGGAGFLGRIVVQSLLRRGYRVRVASRRPHLANFVQPLGNPGLVLPVQANLRNKASIERAVQGADYVVNLVALLAESGKQTFQAVHVDGARAIAEAVARAGIGLTHVSAIGADADSASAYASTKAEGEAAVLAAMPTAVILRPSIMFGAGDNFFNRFANMARFTPFLPMVGANTKFQPVYVADVAEVVARSVDGDLAGGAIYELGGPDVCTFRELMQEMLNVTERKRVLINIPFGIAKLQAAILQNLPGKLLTVDQVELLKSDNVVSQRAVEEKRDFAGLGIKPHATSAILPSYLWRYRVTGQFFTQPTQ